MEGQPRPVGVPHHVAAVVGESVGMVQLIADRRQAALRIVFVADEGVAELGLGHVQRERPDEAPGVLDQQVPSARFTDRAQPALHPFVEQPVAAQIADAAQRHFPQLLARKDGQRLREVIGQIALGAHPPLVTVVAEPRAIHQLQHRRRVALRGRQRGEQRRPGIGMEEHHAAVGRIDLQPRIGRALPADAARPHSLAPRGVVAHPVHRDAPGQAEVHLLDADLAGQDVHRLRAQHLALQEAGVHVLEELLPELLEARAHRLAEARLGQLAQAREGAARHHAGHRDRRRAAHLHRVGDRQVEAGGQQVGQLELFLLRPRRAGHARDLAAQHRQREVGQRIAIGHHGGAAHEQLVVLVRDHRREREAGRDVHHDRRGAGRRALHAHHLDGRADEGQVVEGIEHHRQMRRRQRHRAGRRGAQMDVDAQLRVTVLGGEIHAADPWAVEGAAAGPMAPGIAIGQDGPNRPRACSNSSRKAALPPAASPSALACASRCSACSSSRCSRSTRRNSATSADDSSAAASWSRRPRRLSCSRSRSRRIASMRPVRSGSTSRSSSKQCSGSVEHAGSLLGDGRGADGAAVTTWRHLP